MATCFVILRWIWPSLELLLIALLFKRRLARRYPFFTGALCFGCVQQFVMLSREFHTINYLQVWAWLELAYLPLLVAAIVELTKRVMQQYAALGMKREKVLFKLFAIACVAGVLGMKLYEPDGSTMTIAEHMAFVLCRTVSFTVSVFLLGLELWANVLPRKMARNVYLHQTLLSLYGGLIPGATIVLLRALWEHPHMRNGVNLASWLASMTCLVVWMMKLKPEGESLNLSTTTNSQGLDTQTQQIAGLLDDSNVADDFADALDRRH